MPQEPQEIEIRALAASRFKDALEGLKATETDDTNRRDAVAEFREAASTLLWATGTKDLSSAIAAIQDID